MGHVDPILLPLLSQHGIRLMSAGGSYTRVQKTLRVGEIPLARRTLDVCTRPIFVDGITNCSQCFKCKRTLITLEAGGMIADFSNVFDLRKWSEVRTKYLQDLTWARDPLSQEVLGFARDAGLIPRYGRSTKALTRRIHSRSRAIAHQCVTRVTPKESLTPRPRH